MVNIIPHSFGYSSTRNSIVNKCNIGVTGMNQYCKKELCKKTMSTIESEFCPANMTQGLYVMFHYNFVILPVILLSSRLVPCIFCYNFLTKQELNKFHRIYSVRMKIIGGYR